MVRTHACSAKQAAGSNPHPSDRLGLFAAIFIADAQTNREVKMITIHSGWGGLGASEDLTIQIIHSPSGLHEGWKSR